MGPLVALRRDIVTVEVANKFMTFMLYGIGGHILSCVKEGLSKRKWAVFFAAASEGFNELTGFFESCVVSGRCLGVAVFLGGVGAIWWLHGPCG
jgi:hypothetical protein